MKTINYNGGIVSFKLPSDWKEEYYDDGNAAFYRDDIDSGTLRLSMQSIESNEEYAESFELLSESDMFVVDGYPLKEQIILANEGGDDVLIYSWKIVIPIDAKGSQVVLFSYTISASKEADLNTNVEINFIRNTIVRASYSSSNN